MVYININIRGLLQEGGHDCIDILARMQGLYLKCRK